jgi:hypothetical protein
MTAVTSCNDWPTAIAVVGLSIAAAAAYAAYRFTGGPRAGKTDDVQGQ